jgi:DNA-binding LacI/PurR family transcriptional regulator
MTPEQKGTLASVAKVAGVSKQTVSNVLNDPMRVKAETRTRVLNAIASQNYVRSAAARQLRTGRSRTLGMRLAPTGSGVNSALLHDRFLHAMTEHAQDAGYRITVFTAPDPTAETLAFDELRSEANIDGFVLIGTHPGDVRTAWLLDKGIPFVTFGRQWDQEQPPHSWTDIDGAAGTRQATEHLLATGHERVAFLGWPQDDVLGEDRRRGWREAMMAAGREGLDLHCIDDVAAARATMSEAMHQERISAVVCASDTLALGVHESALREGVLVDVVGFDDTPVASALGISSVAQPLSDVAAAVMRAMQAQLSDERAAPQQVLLEPQLVVRNTRANSRA